MPRRRGIRRGRLFRGSLAPRDRLVYVGDLLDWAYAKGKSLGQLQEEALAWWIGLKPEQIRRAKPEEWSNILQLTARWKWRAIQTTIRETIERIYRLAAE